MVAEVTAHPGEWLMPAVPLGVAGGKARGLALSGAAVAGTPRP